MTVRGPERTPAHHESSDTEVLRLVPRPAEVVYIRKRKPLATRIAEAGGSLATLKDATDWSELSEMLFGDSRLALTEKPTVRDGNVIELPVRRQRSTSSEIQAVRLLEERRGKHR